MRFLGFVLPLVSAFVGLDQTLEHIELKVDKSVKPCDDFYRHVCPDYLTNDDFLIPEVNQWFAEAVGPYYPKTIMNVILANAAEANRVRTKVPHAVLRSEFLKRCSSNETIFRHYYYFLFLFKRFTNCVEASELMIERIHHSNLTEIAKADLEENLKKLQRYSHGFAWHKYIEDEKNGFAKKEERAKEMFAAVKDTMLKQLLDSTWVQNHKLEKNVTDVMNQIRYFLYKGNPYEQAFEEVEQKYQKCTSDWITGHFNMEYDWCLSRAIETSLGEQTVQLNKFGAHIERNRLVVMNPPMYGLLETQDEMRVLTSFGYVLAHEVGHAMFVNRNDFAESESPVDIKCVKEEMKETCRLFEKNWECHSGSNTIKDDAADLAARTTTLEMAQKLILNTNTTNPAGANSPSQMFFYGIGTLWCYQRKENKPGDAHSSAVVRVNGVLRQSEEFRKAFQCTAGDAMVMKENERCHLFGKFAMH